MRREPTPEEHEKIVQAILAGDRIEATNLYISITGNGLTEAQNFVRALTMDMTDREPERFIRKSRKKEYFGRF